VENWVCVYSSAMSHQSEMIKNLLNEEEIESVIVNKQDSLYIIGDIEVHVAADDVIKALQIINNSGL
jgi:hypothetical protein